MNTGSNLSHFHQNDFCVCDFAELKKRQVFSLVFYSCNDNKNKHSKTQQPCSQLNAHRRGNVGNLSRL